MLLSPIAWAVLGLLLFEILLSLYACMELRRLIKEVSILKTNEDLHRYRQMAARQMYLALVLIGMVILKVVVLGFGLVLDWISLPEMFCIGLFLVPYALIGVWVKQLEVHVQSIPAANQECIEERDRIVQVWRKRILPTW
jgi:archaellum biogenesis protein FlaJ (TadC family)